MNWVTLRDVLTINPSPLTVVEAVVYKQAALKAYPRGLVLKAVKRGMDFPRRQQKILHRGQFVISILHTPRKLWGIVPPELHQAVITSRHRIFDLHPDLHPDYFAAYLSTPSFQQAAFAACSSQGWLVLRQFMKIPILLFSPEEQQQIANLWRYGNMALEQTAEMFSSIAALKSGVMHDLFQHPDAAWDRRTLGDYAEIGQNPALNYAMSLLPPDQLTLGADLVLKGGVGIMPNGELDPLFLYYYLKSQKQMLSAALRELPIALPTLYEQRKLATIIQHHNEALMRLRAEQSALRKLIQGIVHGIFSGTLNLAEALPVLRSLRG